jgi:hypothetical protein
MAIRVASKQRSFAARIVADAISGLVGSEVLKDPKALTGAMIALRQMVIALERGDFASKNDVDKCFELISIMEREV